LYSFFTFIMIKISRIMRSESLKYCLTISLVYNIFDRGPNFFKG
jgi:hypothetical protein